MTNLDKNIHLFPFKGEVRMKRNLFAVIIILILGFFLIGCNKKAPVKKDYSVVAVPLTQVDIQDEFWAPKQEVNRMVSIKHCFQKSEERGRTGSISLIEAAGYMIAKRRDPAFEAYIKEKVDKLIEAQAARQKASSRRWRFNPAMRGGRGAEAAVAYYEATGDRRLLDNEIKSANLTCETYGPDKEAYISGHEGQKIGLIRLYRHTGDERYWWLAKFFLDIRGQPQFDREGGPYVEDKTYAQNHKPVIEQREAIGHCVRAMYLYIPLTDIAALTGHTEYVQADDRIWKNVVSKKIYLTGSIGSICHQEKFGEAYELPNLSAYCETCAAYGNVVWNHRLFLLHRDARYIDVMERVLYNGFLDGVAIKGNRFFYQNPLMSYGNYERSEWFNVPCCPPNVVRLMASVGSYIYAQTGSEIYVNLFVGNQATINLDKTKVRIKQETRYPWEGKIKIAVDPELSSKFSLHVRIPGWTQNQPLPSDLYRYLDPTDEKPRLKVNGKAVEIKLEKGYVGIVRKWKPGDVVELELPMPVHKVLAHPEVQDDRGRVALERGPLVYCAEWPDNGGSVLNIVIEDDAHLTSEFHPDLLNGVEVITGQVFALTRASDGVTVESKLHNLVAIPFYAWANRGKGEMAVWMAREESKARLKPVLPDPISWARSFGGIEDSYSGYNRINDISAVYDGVEPLHSRDESYLYYRMFPPTGNPAWIEYEFKAPTEVSSSEVYFVDDERFCRLPQSWRILYKDGSTWKQVKNLTNYGVEKNKFNRVTFELVKSRAIRIEIEPQTIVYKAGTVGPPDAMTMREDTVWRELGIIEWRIQ
jgi:DUF1680 family protein